METITNYCPFPEGSLFEPLQSITKWILWLWVKREKNVLLHIPVWALSVCLAWGASTQWESRERRGHNKYSLLKGVWTGTNPWQGHNARWDGSSRRLRTQRETTWRQSETQWGYREGREGDQIRSRGENWDRFSCRCWDNRRTNDLIVKAFQGAPSVGVAELDHRPQDLNHKRLACW